MIRWQYFPRSASPPESLTDAVRVFEEHGEEIDSAVKTLKSNAVLAIVRESLVRCGFRVEAAKSRIGMPVLYGPQGKADKTFFVDAWSPSARTVLEVEAGRAVVNHQFLKDIFEASVIDGVDHLGIAVRNRYGRSDDFRSVSTFLDTLYASDRLHLNLKGIMVIGY